jgi:hypothetical protein
VGYPRHARNGGRTTSLADLYNESLEPHGLRLARVSPRCRSIDRTGTAAREVAGALVRFRGAERMGPLRVSEDCSTSSPPTRDLPPHARCRLVLLSLGPQHAGAIGVWPWYYRLDGSLDISDAPAKRTRPGRHVGDRCGYIAGIRRSALPFGCRRRTAAGNGVEYCLAALSS